jgi:hypothetical protein
MRNRIMKRLAIRYALVVGLTAGAVSAAKAETVKFEALVAQKEALRLDFADGSKHFFLLVHREGKSEGQGVLADATVEEYGAHDIVRPSAANPAAILNSPRRMGTRPTLSGRSRRSSSRGPTASQSFWTMAFGRS